MSELIISKESIESINNFTLPKEIGFGTTMAPVMIICDYEHGKWGPLKLLPYGPIQMHPTAKVLHYGQEIFEGLKAYKVNNDGPYLFRVEKNAARFNHSAKRMAMPELPVETFEKSIETITSYCSSFIPRRTGESLYIRPFMFATEESLGIKPSSSFRYMVIASPSGSYFSEGTLAVLVERNSVRACTGGTGTAKTGGNYAASLLTSKIAHENGYLQTLWLDAIEHRWIEEMSGMNFIAIIDEKIVTPQLTDTILDGITRNSILTIAREEGIEVIEKKMDIQELIQDIRDQKCTEAFACGTAAIITPIGCLGEVSGERYHLKETFGPTVKKLRQAMLDIQEGRRKAPEGWVRKVEPAILK